MSRYYNMLVAVIERFAGGKPKGVEDSVRTPGDRSVPLDPIVPGNADGSLARARQILQHKRR